MRIENKNGIKWISCDNVGEVISEFKKFREARVVAGKKREYRDYFFLQMLRFEVIKVKDGIIPSEKISEVVVYQQDGVDLSLNLAPLNFKEKDWSPYSQKIKKILKEIWETGEVKDYQGLDLNWPAVSLKVCCDQCHKTIEGKLAWFSDREKDLDFCSESCYSKYKSNNNLKKTNHKKVWLIIGTISFLVIVLFFLAVWFKKRKKIKK